MNARFANNVSQLCPAAGFSRTEFYRLRKLPGAPVPRSDGRHSISAWRKFAKSKESSVKPSSERERLEVELLRKRIRRADLEIAELDNSRHEEIANQITAECLRVVGALNSQLWRMPTELSGVFSMLGEPMAIYKRFKAELNERFQASQEALQKIKEQSRRKTPKNKKGGRECRTV